MKPKWRCGGDRLMPLGAACCTSVSPSVMSLEIQRPEGRLSLQPKLFSPCFGAGFSASPPVCSSFILHSACF